MNKNETPIYLNTWVIVLAFCIFWPAGIVLLIMRINSNKKSMFDGSTTTKICYAIGAILILAGLGTFSNSFFAGLFYTIGGAALIYYGNKNKKKVERYKQYIDLVINQGITSLDTISNTLNISYDISRNEILTLISKGTFKGARIDDVQRCIVTTNPVASAPRVGIEEFANSMSQLAGSLGMANGGGSTEVIAKCPGCGGTMAAIKGQAVECDYCGKMYSA